MSINFHESPFDILVKNFFEANSKFYPAAETKSPHPIDIYENLHGLCLEIACTGLSREDVEINLEHDIIRISYNKQTNPNEDRVYQVKNIAQRSFNLGYKISSRFNLSKAEAEMKNGLLVISIPFAEESKPKTLKIK